MRAFQANLWLFPAWASRWKISVRFASSHSPLTDVCRRLRKAMLGFAFKVKSRGDRSFWRKFIVKIIYSFGPTWFRPRILPHQTNTKTTWSRGMRVNLHMCLQRRTKKEKKLDRNFDAACLRSGISCKKYTSPISVYFWTRNLCKYHIYRNLQIIIGPQRCQDAKGTQSQIIPRFPFSLAKPISELKITEVPV